MARCASAERGCAAASHPATGNAHISWAFPQNPQCRQVKNSSSNQSDPLKILLSTSKSQMTQTPPKAFSVLQGAQFIHEIKLPDHTLADQLCPLSPSSAASRGREKQNHHPHTPQQSSQACCSLKPQRQTCLRNVQREKSQTGTSFPHP